LTKSFETLSQNAIPPEAVAKVILKAVLSDNPDFRYLVDEDAKSILEVRNNNFDREFHTYMKEQFGF
jgi:hypothetical protein